MKNKRRIPSLDGWRGISIILVIIGHEIIDGGHFGIKDSKNILHFFAWHLYGVQIFFVISGFIITHLLIKEERLNSVISISSFYIRRSFRIIPALYSYLLILFLISHFYHGEIIKPAVWLLSFCFISNFQSLGTSWSAGHLWSLSVEEQFYLLWPLLFYLKGKLRLIVPIIFIAISVVARVIEYKHPGYVGKFSFFLHADAIFIGCLFALYREKFKKISRPLKWTILILTLVLFCSQQFTIPFTGYISIPFTHVLFSVSMVILINSSFSPVSVLYKILNSAVLVWIGRISYSLYLWQQLFYPVSIFGPQPFTFFPLNILCMFAMAYLTYIVIEKPVLSLRPV